MITVRGLSKSYRQPVLRDLSAEFPSNSISFVLGPNGSGKTTLMACLLGLLSYTGEVRFDGEPIEAVRHRIAPVFDDTPFYPHLTGRQNLRILGGVDTGAIDSGSSLSDDLLDTKVREYSHGQLRKLALLQARAAGADIVLLDEVSNGLDHESVIELRHALRDLAEEATILTTGHQFDFYEPIIDRLFLLVDGQLVDIGDFQANVLGLEELYEQHFLKSQR